ncbi:hypothetical protein F4808DRAFT_209779 [Astrocystis sublimbata]|nr:hypothetical protein F4808DRAFT_209779 [Astrocystis sublimbata]
MASTGLSAHTDQYQPSSAAAAAPNAAADQPSPNLGKDEVAWFFVEQYYTTLSKNPEKLHLFYGKRSQFVYGQEGQTANVSVGRQVIQDRIKDLDFQNCKVRVSNVDSQASFENIVIQVIGETSNKAGDPKKFVQTFVLAQQPSGYFVLNDILRFIDEEGEEESAEEPQTEGQSAETKAPVADAQHVKEPESSAQELPVSLDPEIVDKKLEEVSATPQESASVNGEAAPEPTAEESVPAAEASTEDVEATPDPDAAARELAEETAQEPEKPKDPSPTPIASRPPPVAAAPTPAQPPKPMTWASRLAASGPPKVSPATPLPKTATAPTPARPAAPSASNVPQTATPAAQATETTAAAAPTKESGPEWQTAGSDSKRQNRPQSISAHPAAKEGTLGYVKYVTDKVQDKDLETALAKYGELEYFDINRQKNCAFVEFKTAAGYNAAANANPHVINGENIVVEPRRPKAGAYGGSNFNPSGRGNPRGGRGGFEAGRSGSHGSRGSFGGQNRGRGGPARGRGTSQAVNV